MDPLGEDYDPSVFSRGLDKLVPNALARRAVAIDVETDRAAYAPGDRIEIRVTVTNRLPVPIEVPIAGQRIWGWTVDGFLEGADERTYEPDGSRTLALRAGESRTYEREWNGRVRHDAARTTYDVLDRGDHEITAFLGTDPKKTATTTIRVR
ncbi:hypothetical protein JCM17823_21310 [Halorubrum gandharaense]